MTKSKASFAKKQIADKKRKIQKEKFEKRLEKKDQPGGKSWEDMIMYVDKDGNFTKTPPAEETGSEE